MFRSANHNSIVIKKVKQLESFTNIRLFLGTQLSDDANAFTQSLFTNTDHATKKMKIWKFDNVLLKSIM